MGSNVTTMAGVFKEEMSEANSMRLGLTGNRIAGKMGESSRVVETKPPDQEYIPILRVPTIEAARNVFFITGTKTSPHRVHTTRPSEMLAQEFKRVLDLESLEDLWYPTSLIAWSYQVIQKFVDHHTDTIDEPVVSPFELLAAARFGEAQLRGASEDVMRTVLKELSSMRFRTQQQWKKLVNPHHLVRKVFATDFKGNMIQFVEPRHNGKVILIHEFHLPDRALEIMQFAFDQIDILMSQDMQRIRHQAFVSPVDVNDLDEDDRACPICLLDYEMEKSQKNGRYTPRYDCLRDNQQPVKLTCGHIFGTTCIEKWLYENNSCCMCRAILIGEGRKMQSVAQEELMAITTYDEGRAFMYYEDIEWNPNSHDDIMRIIQSGDIMVAIYFLEEQLKRLKEIDLRLGVPRSNTSTPVAEWMNKDWLMFAENSIELLNLFNRYYTSDHRRISSSDDFKMFKRLSKSITEMLNTHSKRWQL